MSTESTPPETPPLTPTESTLMEPELPGETQKPGPLSLHERRVLGVLVEKAKTTPDAYPLTLSSLITGCNQKSNREPVLHLTDADVEEAVAGLKKQGLVQQITGSGRVDKYRHVLYEALQVEKVQMAILAELLLRGPQTEGELRARASRMEPIPGLEELRGPLRQLAERGLVVYLTPEGRRGTTVTHGFHPPDELERLKARTDREIETVRPTATRGPSRHEDEVLQRIGALETTLGEIRAELARLQEALAQAVGHAETARPETGS